MAWGKTAPTDRPIAGRAAVRPFRSAAGNHTGPSPVAPSWGGAFGNGASNSLMKLVIGP